MKSILAAMATLFIAVGVQAKTVEIKMLNSGKDGPMVFEPGFVKVDPGDTVKFVKVDMAHNSESVVVPDGAKAWTGKMDEEISVKLDKEGVYVYKCQPHAMMAMVGVIQVGKPTNLEKAKAEATKLSSTFVMNKDRLTKYLGSVK